MTGMLLNSFRTRPVWRSRAVTVKAQDTRRFAEQRVIGGAMRVVTGIARDPVGIHQASHEIIALHPVFVSRAIRKVGEGGFS